MAAVNIIGVGHMGGAIANALHAGGLRELILVDTDASRLKPFHDRCANATTALAALGKEDVVILAIPPQAFTQFAAVSPGLRGHPGLVLSVMAGLSVGRMSQALHTSQIVRSIPNTPSEVGWGMSVFFAHPEVTGRNLDLCRSTLRAIGEVLQVEHESMLDPATALCGGGPAFVSYFLDAMRDYGVSAGFSEHDAMRMALQVMRGTGELVSRSGKSPMQICHEVMTPAGTTERGIRHLEKAQFKALLADALKTSAARSHALNSTEE